MAPVHAHPSGRHLTDGVELALHDLGGDGPAASLLCHPTGLPRPGVGAGGRRAGRRSRTAGRSTSGATATRALPAERRLGLARASADDVLRRRRPPRRDRGRPWRRRPLDGRRRPLLAEHAPAGHLRRACGSSSRSCSRRWRAVPAGPNPGRGRRAGAGPSFPDRDAAYANYAAKPPLSALDPAALRAYVDHGFARRRRHRSCSSAGPRSRRPTFDAGIDRDAFERLGEVREPRWSWPPAATAAAPATLAPARGRRPPPRARSNATRSSATSARMEDPALVAEAIGRALGLR